MRIWPKRARYPGPRPGPNGDPVSQYTLLGTQHSQYPDTAPSTVHNDTGAHSQDLPCGRTVRGKVALSSSPLETPDRAFLPSASSHSWSRPPRAPPRPLRRAEPRVRAVDIVGVGEEEKIRVGGPRCARRGVGGVWENESGLHNQQTRRASLRRLCAQLKLPRFARLLRLALWAVGIAGARTY